MTKRKESAETIKENLKEQIISAEAAAKATPTAQEAQAALDAQEISETLKAQEKQAQAAENMQEFLRTAKAAAAEQQEESAQLMGLSLAQIEALPDEKKKIVWMYLAQRIAETPGFATGINAITSIETLPEKEKETLLQTTAQQIIETPGFADGINVIAALGKGLSDTITEWRPIFQKTVEGLAQSIADIRTAAGAITSLFSDDTAIALRTWDTLQPYINAEAEENPEKYEDQTDIYALLIAAAKRARADGKDIPPLRGETPEAEQTETLIPAGIPATDNPAALLETLKKIPPLNPQAHIMTNNALMNAMQKSGLFNAGEIALVVIPEKGRQKEITAYTIVNYEPDETGTSETSITITDPKLTEYERNVSNAIISLWVEAEKRKVEPVFTTDTIYRAMPGGGETASPQQKGAITKAFEKFRRIHMTIDATDELRKRGAIKSNDTFKIDDYYFNVRRARRTSLHSGQSVTAYQMISKPVILQYAEMTSQILSVPARYLTIRKIDKSGRISTELVTMNADRQAITGYMMRRIAVMKHDLDEARDRLKNYERKRKKHPEEDLPAKPLAAFRQQSSVILFDTLFSTTDTETENREQARRNRDFCLDVLEYWKATGFIKGYSTQIKGRKITGIAIEI